MMKKLFDEVSRQCAQLVTKKYSTSFSIAVKLLSPKIRADIYNIYGFVRFADEIVDSFHNYPKEELFNKFETEYKEAVKIGISLNPIINAFQNTVTKYQIDQKHVQSFLDSMRADLTKENYQNQQEMETYIYGSADVVGLMCLKVFVNGDEQQYQKLKAPAMRLGTAFQKVNFLRDLKDDYNLLNRSYFPNLDLKNITNTDKERIIQEIKDDFKAAYKGIKMLPIEAQKGVYVAYKYYLKLLKKIEKASPEKLMNQRIRVSNPMKLLLLIDAHFRMKLNYY